jgi:peptidoglycan/LPS O-acetylase OafA/YrhL
VKRRTDIEGLRAVAVLLVLLFHAGVPGMDGGYVGVDVFFVLSGFLITSLMVAEREETGRVSLAGFYARRIRRILPMSSLVAVATLGAAWVWLEPLRLRGLATDVLASAGFSSNLVFAHRGADYLQSSLPPSPLQHFWSLAVEEQFYVVWPALVILVLLGVPQGRPRVVRVRIGVLSASVTAASFAVCMALMGQNQVWAFYRPHARAFELAAGALLAVLPVSRGRQARRAEAAFSWAGLAVIVASAFVFDEGTRFPGPWALVPVVATLLVLRGGTSAAWSVDAVLRAAPAQWLGSRSYSAYLWHWPVLVITASAAGRDLSLAEGLVCVVFALALSELSWRFVEDPVRSFRSLAGARAFAFGASMLLVVAGTGLLARANPPQLEAGPAATTPQLPVTSTTAPAGTATGVPAPDGGAGATTTTAPAAAPVLPRGGAPIQPVVDALYVSRVPSNLQPSLGGALGDMPTIYNDDCHAGFGVTEPKDCVFGDPASTTVVGLYGDSHAAEWFPAFEKVAIKNKWRLITYTKRGCPPADIEVYSKVLGKVYKECGPWRENTIEKMRTDGVKVVFVAAFERLLDAESRIPIWQKPWRDGLRGTFDTLRAAGITPVLVEDTPYPDQDVPTCLSRNRTTVTGCNIPVSAGFRPDLAEMRDDFESEGTAVLRTRHWFCTDTLCPVIVGNLLVYRDDNHMTVSYARWIAPLLDADIVPFVDWYSRTP